MGRKAIRETTWGKQSGAENARGGEKDEGGGGARFLFVRGMLFPPVAGNAFLLLRETLSSCREKRFFLPRETVPSCQAGGNVLK